MIAKNILEALRSANCCLTLDELQEITKAHKTLLEIYLSKLWEEEKIIKKREKRGRRRLTVYCLNQQ